MLMAAAQNGWIEEERAILGDPAWRLKPRRLRRHHHLFRAARRKALLGG